MTPAVGQTWRRTSTGQVARITDTDARYVHTEPIGPGRRSRVLTEAFTRQWVQVDTEEERTPQREGGVVVWENGIRYETTGEA